MDGIPIAALLSTDAKEAADLIGEDSVWWTITNNLLQASW